MNIFSKLTVYAGKWSVKESRAFTAEELASVIEAIVVASEYGNSVEFSMKTGGKTYIPLSQDSDKSVGEFIDLSKVKLLTLEKQGESDIFRIDA